MKNLTSILLILFEVSIYAQTKEIFTKNKYEISTNRKVYLENFDALKIIQFVKGNSATKSITYVDRTVKGSKKNLLLEKGCQFYYQV